LISTVIDSEPRPPDRRETVAVCIGDRLHGEVYSTSDSPSLVYVCVHGLGDHGKAFASFACRVVDRSTAVVTFDQRGHGQSPGRRGHVTSYDDLLRGIAAAREFASKRFPDARQILMGHSMGGNLVLNYSLRRDEVDPASTSPDALVLLAPMLWPPLKKKRRFPSRQEIAAAWLTGHLVPWLRIRAKVDAWQLTSDPEFARYIQDDPLRHEWLSIYLATQLLSQGRYAIDHARDLQDSTLILFGTADKLIDHDAIDNTARRAHAKTTTIAWADGRHDLLNDHCGADVSRSIHQWSLRQLAARPSILSFPKVMSDVDSANSTRRAAA
jgi:alpha-beta hydrolase superfamily lysophospholipase